MAFTSGTAAAAAGATAAGTAGAGAGAAAGGAAAAGLGAGTSTAGTAAASGLGAGVATGAGAGLAGAAGKAGLAGATAAKTAGANAATNTAANVFKSKAADWVKDKAKEKGKEALDSTAHKAAEKIDEELQDNEPSSSSITPSNIPVVPGNKSNRVDMVSSSIDNKQNITNVSQSKAARLNDAMRRLGSEIMGNKQAQPQSQVVSSDENLKTDVQEAGGIIPLMAEIDSYLYQYTPEAQKEYAGTGMMNDKNNLGVMAQDLQKNPLTEPAVIEDEKGNLALDSGRLASINTAVIAELCKKVMDLEGKLNGRG